MRVSFSFTIHFPPPPPKGATAPSGPGASHCRGCIWHSRRTTVGRTPLDEWSARRRDLYLTIHNTHNGQKSMIPAGFEPAIPASERTKTHILDRAANGIGHHPHSSPTKTGEPAAASTCTNHQNFLVNLTSLPRGLIWCYCHLIIILQYCKKKFYN